MPAALLSACGRQFNPSSGQSRSRHAAHRPAHLHMYKISADDAGIEKRSTAFRNEPSRFAEDCHDAGGLEKLGPCMAFMRSPVRSRSGPPILFSTPLRDPQVRRAHPRLNTVGRMQCYTDVMSTDELLAEALRLTRVDRARVAEELLSSLEESDDEVATAWATGLERRSREVAEGHVQTISWETARTEILKELEQRRAPRTAS